jgi:hypothetical protein
MNPPQTVVVKSGCGKASLIIFAILLFIALLIGGCFVAGLYGIGKVANQVEETRAENARLASALVIDDFQWEKGGFGSIMTASFKITNTGTVPLKDITIECRHTAPSGTQIDKNTRIIYELIQPGETKEFRAFNMGFINSQVSSSVPVITSAKPVP